MSWGTLFVLLFSIQTFAQDLEVSPGLQICQNLNKPDEGCEYHVVHADAQYLINEATRRVFHVSNGSIPDSEGYIRPGKNNRIIVFKVKPSREEFQRGVNERRDQLIEFFKNNDVTPGVFNLEAIDFKVAFYVISMSKAKSMGIGLNFTIKGLIEKDLPAAAGSQGSFAINLGNLTSHMFNIFFQSAASSGLIVDSEQYTFRTYHGAALPFYIKRILYRDNSAGITTSETMMKFLSGKLFLNPNNKKEIAIHGFDLGYWLPSSDGVSLAEKFGTTQEYQPLILGEQSVLTLESNKTAVVKKNGIFNTENESAEASVKILASITAESPKARNSSDNNIYFNPRTGLYNFKDEYLEQVRTDISPERILDAQNMSVSVIPSPVGIFGSTIAVQFNPLLASKNSAQSFAQIKIVGEGIEHIQTVQLQNLMAGPYLINGFDIKTVNKYKNDRIPFKVVVELPQALANLNEAKPFKKEYLISYFPSLFKACVEEKKENKCN